MKKRRMFLVYAALLAGAAVLPVPPAWAGSCCGGGTATSLILPAYGKAMIDLSADLEKYDGFWNQKGQYTPDPPESDLRQYRFNAGYAQRLAPQWQMSLIVPYVRNDNRYSGLSSHSDGLGDTSLNLWYEALGDESSWKVRSFRDLQPMLLIGPSLLVPTGVSPYDDVKSSFDVTGRGFYRLDANVYLDKTIHPFDLSLAVSYGTHIERAVNREYGNYVEPYHKKLGDRTSAVLSAGYIGYIGTGGRSLTATASFAYLREADATINGTRTADSGFRKESLGAAISYAGTDQDWSLRASWSHTLRRDGWGDNFPATDIYSLGVRYVFR